LFQQNAGVLPNEPASITPQRQNSKLASKAKTTNVVGKGAIQIAQELLVEKLGELSPQTPSTNHGLFEQYGATL